MASFLRPLALIVAASVLLPVLILLSPVLTLLAQFGIGCWLAAASWILVSSTQSRLVALETNLGSIVGCSLHR